MLADRDGLASVTISAVATESGVSRPAIYRRWPSRAALLFEAQTYASVDQDLPDLGSLRAELLATIPQLVRTMNEGDRTLTASMLGQMIVAETFSAEVWANRWGPDSESIYLMWQRALDRGEVRSEVDGRAVIDDLVASCIFQVYFLHRTVGLEQIEALVDRIIHGVAAPTL